MIQNGLKPIKKLSKKWYPTDRSFHKTFGGITPVDFPKEFSVDAGLTMPDQIADGLFLGCTSYTQNELCTDQDIIAYDDYEYTYRKTLEMEGIYQLNLQGCDIRDSLKIVCTLGPRTKKVDDEDGEKKARGAYYAVESSQFDWFDSMRSVMLTNFQVNKIKCAISIGTPWFREWDVVHVSNTGIVSNVFTGDPATLAWHNWAIKGWKEINGVTYLVAKTWQGKSYGDHGWTYYDRETINKVMKIRYTGAFTVAPRDASNVGFVKKNLMEVIIAFADRLIQLLLKKKVSEPVTPVEPPAPVVPPPIEPKYKWESTTDARHSIRVICDEERLSVEDKNLICAVIQAESGFKNTATHDNKTSIDWGICQINDFYHIGPGKSFPNVGFVLKNPDVVVRWMIKQFKLGNLDWWIAYKNGSYKRYL